MPDDQLVLAGADRGLLTDVLRRAVAAPGDEPAAPRLAAAALSALAADGDDGVAAAALGDGPFEVRVRGAADASAPSAVTGLTAGDALRAFLGTARRAPQATVEVVATPAGAPPRTVLERGPDDPPRLRVDDAARRRLGALLAAPSGTAEAPVAALAEVLAHLPTRDDIAEAVTAALAGATVEVDATSMPAIDGRFGESVTASPEAIADAVLDRLVAERRVPRAHDVADLLSSLLPTAAEVAEVASQQLGTQVEAGFAELRRANAELVAALASVADRLHGLEATATELERQVNVVRSAVIG